MKIRRDGGSSKHWGTPELEEKERSKEILREGLELGGKPKECGSIH